MDTSGPQEPYRPSRRQPRSSGPTSGRLTRPEGAGEAAPQVVFGRIDAVHQSPDGTMVELFRANEGRSRFPVSLFPSRDWVVTNVGRWVALNGKPGEGKLMPSPEESCRHVTDPSTGELCLLCGDCGVEMGRLAPTNVKGARQKLVQQIKDMLNAHLTAAHPEILKMFNDPWRQA